MSTFLASVVFSLITQTTTKTIPFQEIHHHVGLRSQGQICCCNRRWFRYVHPNHNGLVMLSSDRHCFPGINHVFVQMLLEAGCSVVIADLKLTAEAENTLQKYSKDNAATNGAYAIFHPTDLVDWSQINSLWETALATFPQVDIVCNGAGLYEPPASSFWSPPGVSPLAEDPADAKVGQYKTFSVNTIAPIRLAQIAIDYWLQNRSVQGNLIWVASLGAYVHSVHTPMYFASKAAIVSMVKSLGRLRKEVGIRNAAVCPGATDVSSCPQRPPYLSRLG